MKLPDLGSTSAPALAPDLGPGQGQARDDALDAAAREGMAPAIADYVPPPALADVDAAIAEGRAVVASSTRCLTCSGSGWVPRGACDLAAGHIALIGYGVCPGCGGTRESER